MIYDIHVHIGRWMPRFGGGSGDALHDLVARAELHGIDRVCVSSLGARGYLPDPSPEELREANDHVLEAMAAYPERVIGFCVLNPRHREGALAEMERCVVQGGMAGVKLWIACNITDPLVDPILDQAATYGVPVLQHAWYKRTGQLDNESTPADVAEAAQRHPGATIIMAHLMGAGMRGVLDIAALPNVCIDTSGGDPEAGLIEYAVRRLGAERVLFGSDAPGRSFGVQLGKVVGAHLTPGQRDLVLGGNAERILRR